MLGWFGFFDCSSRSERDEMEASNAETLFRRCASLRKALVLVRNPDVPRPARHRLLCEHSLSWRVHAPQSASVCRLLSLSFLVYFYSRQVCEPTRYTDALHRRATPTFVDGAHGATFVNHTLVQDGPSCEEEQTPHSY
jgi:hypothetical protein